MGLTGSRQTVQRRVKTATNRPNHTQTPESLSWRKIDNWIVPGYTDEVYIDENGKRLHSYIVAKEGPAADTTWSTSNWNLFLLQTDSVTAGTSSQWATVAFVLVMSEEMMKASQSWADCPTRVFCIGRCWTENHGNWPCKAIPKALKQAEWMEPKLNLEPKTIAPAKPGL